MTTTTPPIRLVAGGGHDCGKTGEACLMEAYNWLTRQEVTDSCPPGVSPVLHVFGMRLNDVLPDEKRQQLVRFLPNGGDRLAGTASDGRDETRGYLALDWLIRTWLPGFLDLVPSLTGDAAALRAHARVDCLEAAESIGPVVRLAREHSAAAWAGAGAAAWDAAWAAAVDAAWAAARAAARYAAWDAARAAARAAARYAAGAKLAPTVATLQDSAIALYDVMVTGEWPAVA